MRLIDNDEGDIDPDDWDIPDPVIPSIPGQGNVVPGVVPEVPNNNNGANGGNTENNDPKTDFSISMYSVGGSGLSNATVNAGIDTPLIPITDIKKLESALTPVRTGLMADGVTPLVFKIHIPGKAEKDTKWKLNLKWNRQVVRVEPKFYVLQKGKYLLAKAAKGEDNFSLSFTLPKYNNGVDLYAYLGAVESDSIFFDRSFRGTMNLLLNEGNEQNPVLTLLDGKNEEKVVKYFTIKKPPLVLVHGFNTTGVWGDEYKRVLAEQRGWSDPIEVHYGVSDVIQRDGLRTLLNTTGTFEELAKLLDGDLKRDIEGRVDKPSCWDGYACTRYDVLAHSQGGVLIRMLCSKKEVWSKGFCSADNHYRGRFHRIVTIGSPQNGTSLLYYIMKMKKAGLHVVLPTFYSELYQEKFNPWGEQIEKINNVEVDSRAKFHAIRTKYDDNVVLAVLKDILIDTDDKFKGKRVIEIIFPKGSDGVVDMDSQQAGNTKGSFYNEIDISHSAIPGFEDTQTQTAYPPLGNYVGELFDSKKNFGSFVMPEPASKSWKNEIDDFVESKIANEKLKEESQRYFDLRGKL